MWSRILVTLVIATGVSMLVPRPVAGQVDGIRNVSTTDRSVIPLQTRVRFTTMVVLPEDEEILEVICGDKDYWVISATNNLAHVKPAKEHATTNMNLVTASGTVYSFLLAEGNATSTPDLKVYVNADAAPKAGKPRYFNAAHVESLQSELAGAKAALESEKERTADALATYQQQYPTRLQFVYGTPKHEKPFWVRAIWHDGQFTYIQTDARELPALYETVDGKPSLLNFQVHSGTYVVPKVLDRAYLAIGSEKFTIEQRGR
jgi:type IV secretory pathway VirB9-like protein